MAFTFFQMRKYKHILRHALRVYQKRQKKLSPSAAAEIQEMIILLQEAIAQGDVPLARERSSAVEKSLTKHVSRSLFDRCCKTAIDLGLALIIAVIVRQTWFELYEIPSGSMRPTFKEQDRLIVSKNQFGINFPLRASHLLFEPEEVQRGGIVIFTGENMDIADKKTRYFYIFPGTKQYVKRMMGLPGDTLYFYGGKVYGIDKEGNDISPLYRTAAFETLEHIPFIHLEGKVVAPKSEKKGNSSLFLHQMNIPIAKLSSGPKNDLHKELLVSPKGKESHFDLHDLWGMGNYATARILTQEQLFELYHPTSIKRTEYYLELTHHANLENTRIQKDPLGRSRPVVGSYTSVIPLEKEHIERLWQNMYTARFVVKNGYAQRYGLDEFYATTYHNFLPKLRGYIPDATYEFQNGKAYQVGFQGLTKELPSSHPLTQFDHERFYTLFNAGMEFDNRFIPGHFHHTLSPARYAYFRDGDLYLLGAPILFKGDPILQNFTKEELAKASTGQYTPFIDVGAPLNPDGSVDKAKIEKFGLVVPEDHYLALGDNHAMSGDTRDFGFVPKDNIRGVPTLIFWASDSRYGHPNQLPYAIFTMPRLIIWATALLLFILWQLYNKRRYAKLLQK